MQSPATAATDRPQGRRFITCGEVAEELGIHKATVSRLIARGAFPAVRLRPRGAIRIPRDAFEAWLYAVEDDDAGGTA